MEKSNNLGFNMSKEELEYIRALDSIPRLTDEEINSFSITNIHNDTNYRKRIIESNLWRVVRCAKTFRGSGINFIELVQEGSTGLIKAIDRFKYGTYGDFIRSINANIFYAIKNAFTDKYGIIKLPCNMENDIYIYKKCFDKYISENGVVPSIDEMTKIANVTYEQSSSYYNFCFDVLSLNETVDDEEIIYNVVDDNESVENIVEDKLLNAEKKRVLYDAINDKRLTEKERIVLIYRYGFYNNEIYTYRQIAQNFGSTFQNFAEKEKYALKKIRGFESIKYLLDSIDYLIDVDSNERKGNMKSPAQTIYEFFKDYTKQEVDEVISKLTDEDLNRLHKRYDENYNIISFADDEDKYRFYRLLIPKMKKMLKRSDSVTSPKIDDNISDDDISTHSSQENVDNRDSDNLNVSNYDYQEKNLFNVLLQSDMNAIKLEKLFNLISPEETTIVSLKLGLFNKRCITTDAISKILNVDKFVVRNVTKKFLSLYKKLIMEYLDQEISKIINDEEDYQKTK